MNRLKVAVCAQDEGLNAQSDERFGRCPYFVLVDLENEAVHESIRNENVSLFSGAGPQSAQLLSDHDIEAVITGHVGPKAQQALQKAGIKIYIGTGGTVGDNIKEFKEGSLKTASSPTVPGHSGLKQGNR